MSDKNNDDININKERIHLEMDSPLGAFLPLHQYPFISSILFHRRMIRLRCLFSSPPPLLLLGLILNSGLPLRSLCGIADR